MTAAFQWAADIHLTKYPIYYSDDEEEVCLLKISVFAFYNASKIKSFQALPIQLQQQGNIFALIIVYFRDCAKCFQAL